jgi:hypothetical protein
MRKQLFMLATVIVCSFLLNGRVQAQAQDAPKYEAGALFSSITLTPTDGSRTEAGFGGRFTINLTDHIGLETETIFFPNRGFSGEPRAAGRAVQSVFGVKAGKRWEKFGIFAKGRPGLVSFSAGRLVFDQNASSDFPVFHLERATHFALDIGGVIEFYPKRRIVTRFDVGDTIIRYRQQTSTGVVLDPVTGAPEIVPFVLPANTRHNFQFNAGIGIRFD